MECPYCGSELDHEDSFGRIGMHQDGKVLGFIYSCPKGAEESEECESSVFNVAGSFYSYENENHDVLHEGYPC